MKIKSTTLIAIICMVFLLTQAACKKSNNSNPPTNSCEIIYVKSDINSATVWQKNKVYIIDRGATLVVSASLTIEPGCIIKFKGTYGMNIKGTGKIMATGTATEPIIFTSIKDDNYCGDSNADGTASIPEKGNWGGIQLESDAKDNSFVYCKFFYAGAYDPNGGSSHTVIYDQANANTYDHCTFAHTSSPATIINTSTRNGALTLDGLGSSYVCTNNIFYDNGVPIFLYDIEDVSSIENSNTFADPANPAITNTFQCIKVSLHSVDVNGAANFKVNTIPYFLDVSFTGINGKLTLADNAIIKFLGSYLKINNSSTLQNVISSSAKLTSFKDDIGGDSNGDGAASTPQKGDWQGVTSGGTWQKWSNIYYATN